MSTIFGIREIELRADADPDEYERFCREEVLPLMTMEGWKIHLTRGDRGSRAGRYAWVFEMESADARARYFPERDQPSDEMASWLQQHPDSADAFLPGPFVESVDDTDYVDISG